MPTSRKYLNALYERKDEANEHTYRTSFENFLGELIPDHVIRQESKRGSAGIAPDFTISFEESVVGYIETKSIGKVLDTDSDQIEKYRAVCDNIILTDYLTFIWLSGEDTKTVELLSRQKFDQGKLSVITEKEGELRSLLDAFCSRASKPISDLSELAKFLAPRTSALKDELSFLLKNDSKSQLTALRNELVYRLYEGMSDERFVDAIAQCFTYILFMARLLSRDRLTIDNVFSFIPEESFPIQRELARFFEDLKASGSSWIVEQIIRTVNRLDTEQLKGQDPFLYFYEEFLGAYDPTLRTARGVYYTPTEVVSYIVRSLNTILKDVYGRSEGLAGEGVTVLDFATGTGTFLIEAFRVAIDSRSEGLRHKVIDERLLQNFHGFEIMTGPYTIAHMKLYQFLKETYGYSLREKKKRARIYLGNALDAPGLQKLSPFLPALQHEVEEAAKTRQKDILVIMGNPPYAGKSQNNGDWIKGLIQTYKKVDDIPLGERNSKWLNNDYVKFIRFAQHKMEKVDEGLIGIITSNSFLDAPTFRGMRRSLMQSFGAIYILNLHGNIKKREKTPEGGKDEGVFDITEGTCVSFLIKKPGAEKGVFIHDLYGLRAEKFDFCRANDFKSTPWKKLVPQAPFYNFIEGEDSELEEKYYQFYSIKEDIFNTSSPGIKSARDELTMHLTKEKLRAVVKDFMALDTEEARWKYKLGEDVRDWSIDRAKKDLQPHLSNLDELIKPIHYAAFETRYTYYTGTTAGFHCMPRGKFMKRYLETDSFGLLVCREPKTEDFAHAFVLDDIPDGSFFKSNISHFFPLYMCGDASKSATDGERREENIQPSFYEILAKKYGKRFVIEEVVGYVYAILYSPAYRSKYKSFLVRDYPRIPLAPSLKDFSALAEMGTALIAKHRMKSKPTYDKVSFEGRGNCKVERITYDAASQYLYINSDSYFTNIIEEVASFKIGNYKVLDKLLSNLKGSTLTLEQIEHIQRVACTLHDTVLAMRELEKLTEGWI